MPIIKCSECGNKINIKSLECPECGTKITLDDELKKDYSIFKIKRLVSHPISITIIIILFIVLIGIISSNLIFLKTIRGELTLQQASISTYYQEYITLFPIVILNISCISAIVSCLSKRLTKFSRIGYIINIIITLVLYINIYNNNIRVGICYFLILLINTISFIIPIKYKIIEEDILIEKKKEIQLKKKNKIIDQLNDKAMYSKRNIIFTTIFLIIELISIIIILVKNNNDIYKETIIQANSDFQIKITNDYINIRKSSNVESEVLGSVNKNDIYNVLDVTSGPNHIWYKINYKGKIGYIASPRTEPYVKELYSYKLVVNIFCTTTNEECGYLMEFILKYQKSTAKSFIIMYYDLEQEQTINTYNKVLEYFKLEETVPLIVIGNNKISNYTKESELTLIEVIEEEINNKNNIVMEIKKGNSLPSNKKDS